MVHKENPPRIAPGGPITQRYSLYCRQSLRPTGTSAVSNAALVGSFNIRRDDDGAMTGRARGDRVGGCQSAQRKRNRRRGHSQDRDGGGKGR